MKFTCRYIKIVNRVFWVFQNDSGKYAVFVRMLKYGAELLKQEQNKEER